MNWNTTFQESNSPSMEMMMNLYEINMTIMLSMMMLILYIIISFLMNKMNNTMNLENQKMETLWTYITLMLITLITYESIKSLFMTNEMNMSILSVKVISNQWFWTYEYLNLKKKFNSYIHMNKKFNFKNLEVNNKLILPFNKQIQIMSTSMDVIHSWSIPSMNIKIDAIPNHLNQTHLLSSKTSIIFGQCTEICGMNHSLMPIQIEYINTSNFIKWLI